MSNSAAAELYFIAAMMVLILVLSGASVYFFVRQYRREMRAREAERSNKNAAEAQPVTPQARPTDIGLSE
jgi:hypothetical protein